LTAHGDSAAAFVVVGGALTEARGHDGREIADRQRYSGHVQTVERGVLHDVRNTSNEPAISIHAYSPRLTSMTFSRPDLGRSPTQPHRRDPRGRAVNADGSRIDARLAAARERLTRIDPATAAQRHATGHVLVDIRPRDQRRIQGEIPGSIVVERNVLEWRLDPTSDARIVDIDATTPVIVFCQQGYTSSLAASDLLELGRPDVTDIDGGYEAWRAAGLPVVDGGRAADFC